MTTFPNSPRLVKGGIALIDVETSMLKSIIPLQYNPDTLTRSLQVRGLDEGGGDRSEALRLTGPPIETIKIDAEIDAADQLAFPDQNPEIVQNGIHSHLAALEMIIYPSSSQLLANNSLASSGTLEIAPMETPLTIFIWSKNRILPVRMTEFSITEEAFDANLNPIRAKMSLGMRVLSIDDLGFEHKGGNLYMSYHQNKERLAAMFRGGRISDLGIRGIP